jgi:hypothetical protein
MTPLSIYQRALDRVSQAVMAGDFDAYLAQIDLPYLVQTETVRHLLSSADDLRPTFEALTKGLAARGVTHYERLARAADYADCDRIEGWHYTHLIADGQQVEWPKRSSHVIVRRGAEWYFSEADYPIRADHWPFDDATIFGPNALSLPGRGVA